ncbi:MAG: CoA transferase [Acetobacteraceae bacterium]
MFPTSDGQINIAASSGRLWHRFCETIGHPEWAAKPEWSNQAGRSADRATINAAIAETTRTKPAAHWIELFEEAGIPCGPINTIDKVFADPQVKHLGMAAPVEHPRLGKSELVNSPINIQGVPKGVRSAAPDAGADTEAVLREVGLSDAEIQQMRAEGAI